MKRRIAILLSLILLISSSGFTLNKHYCNGELVSIFLLPHLGKCCDSSMPMDDNSCEDEYLGFYLDSPLELIITKIIHTNTALWAYLPQAFILTDNSGINFKTRRVAFVSPPVNNIKIYLRLESFLY